jgi:hypothetical protein
MNYKAYSKQVIRLEKITALVTSKHLQPLMYHFEAQGCHCHQFHNHSGSMDWYKNGQRVAYARRNGFQFEVKFDPKRVRLTNDFFAEPAALGGVQ